MSRQEAITVLVGDRMTGLNVNVAFASVIAFHWSESDVRAVVTDAFRSVSGAEL